MPRLLLSDEHWSKLREILLHMAIYNKRDLRMTVEGMLYRMRNHSMPPLPSPWGGTSGGLKMSFAASAASSTQVAFASNCGSCETGLPISQPAAGDYPW
jgi:hypothetical protein